MCLQSSSVLPWDSFNWAGDEIVYNPIIRASRTIPGKKKRYDIDIREFLTTRDNAVVGQALGDLINKLSPVDQALFRSHAPGSFDLRADKVVEYVSTLAYLPSANKEPRCPDFWLFPDETLAQRGGDCEDLALVLGALLLASGVSPYCVRVALGVVHIGVAGGKLQKHDHCWVMYQNEGSVWEILEPMRINIVGARKAVRRRPQMTPSTEYVPQYVFNADHLWYVNSQHFRPGSALKDYLMDRSFWKKFDPSFAASVHNTIFDRALGDLVPPSGLARIKRKSLWLDVNIAAYDPRDHFDNGYINEGWNIANDRLAQFKQNNSDWESFGAAAHSIGDFYAHSSYLHFAALQSDGSAQPFEPGMDLEPPPSYTTLPFSLTSGLFSDNPNLWPGTPQEAADHWAGQLLSGRYAQKYDPKATFWEGFTSIPTPLATAKDFGFRGSLPHHDEIAVDQENMPASHRLYKPVSSGPNDRLAFPNQFQWRQNTAIQHIRKAFLENRST